MPERAAKAHWVRAPEGVWYMIDGCYESPLMSHHLQPLITELVTDLFRHLGRTLIWEDDVEDPSEYPI